MTKYLIIGNGVAGTTAAEHISKTDQHGDVTMVTDEDMPFYHRLFDLYRSLNPETAKRDSFETEPVGHMMEGGFSPEAFMEQNKDAMTADPGLGFPRCHVPYEKGRGKAEDG